MSAELQIVRHCKDCPEWTHTICCYVFGKFWRDKSHDGTGCAHPLAAVEAIADRYAELVEGRIAKVYDVEVARKYTKTVVADSEGDARAKALDGLVLGDGESVTAEVK